MIVPTLDCLDVALAEKSLSHFIRQAWPVIEPATEYLHNWHIDAICDYLQAVEDGQITRLLINMPPRHMKSIAVSVMFPCWAWMRRPSTQWMFASYGANLSAQHSVDRRTIIQSDWYRQRWGDRFAMTGDQNVKTEYLNDHRGRMFASSFGGGVTGKGADILVCDDPHDPAGVESADIRNRTINDFSRKLSTRLNNKKTGAIIVVMQRLHSEDLSATCIAQGYTHLCLPAESEPSSCITVPGGKVYQRDASGLLWPQREGPREIAQAKTQLGSYGYAGQYLQLPAPAGGGKFKREWFRYYKREGDIYRLMGGSGGAGDKMVRAAGCIRFTTADIAGTEKQTGNDPDYTVFMTWDLTGEGDLILLDMWRDRKEEPDIVRAGVNVVRQNNSQFALIEKNGVGLGVVNTMRRMGVAVKGIVAKTNKLVRAQTAIVRMEAGAIYFPTENAMPGMFDIASELTMFPNSPKDDIVDNVSIAAIYAQKEFDLPSWLASADIEDVALDASTGTVDAGVSESIPPVASMVGDDPELSAWMKGGE